MCLIIGPRLIRPQGSKRRVQHKKARTIPTSFRVGGFLQIFVGLILALAGVLAIFDLHYWKWVCVAVIAAGAMNTVYVALDLFFCFGRYMPD